MNADPEPSSASAAEGLRAEAKGSSVTANGGSHSPAHQAACLNCGTLLQGSHCHECGQKAHLHRTIRGFLHELAHGALHFEGRVWHTLPLLVTRPGELTRRYIEGERVRFVSPLALFLFCVFLMFSVFQVASVDTTPQVNVASPTAERMSAARAGLAVDRERLAAQVSALPPDDPRRATLEENLAELDAGIRQAENISTFFTDEGTQGAARRWTGVAFIDSGIAKFRENPALMFYKLQANSYKFSWLLVPLSIPFVALLFAWSRRFGAYDHAVFVTYSLSFMTLLFVLLAVLGALGVPSTPLVIAGLLVPPVHIYRQLKGTYELRRRSALWRTAALLVFILIVVGLFLNLLLVLGMIG